MWLLVYKKPGALIPANKELNKQTQPIHSDLA